MASGDRFYQLEMRNRPATWGDIGHLIKIEGLIVGGGGAQAILLMPDHALLMNAPTHMLNSEEWSEWLRQSDNPEVLVMPEKAYHRKLRYEISGHVQQKVWVADGFQCVYCGRKMGDVQLTIDHFLPLELGGSNTPSNYLSACRKCNKDKGSQDPRTYCAFIKRDYDTLKTYLEGRQIR